jgi:hypothetical protein
MLTHYALWRSLIAIALIVGLFSFIAPASCVTYSVPGLYLGNSQST